MEHEFFPEDKDMVVISSHTCAATELEEISCNTGANRLYEPDQVEGNQVIANLILLA